MESWLPGGVLRRFRLRYTLTLLKILLILLTYLLTYNLHFGFFHEVNFCHPATSDNGDPGRTPARGQVCEWGPAAPLGNSRNTSHRAVVLPLPSVGAAPSHQEWLTPIH
jgi:hypothetical protein